MTTQLIPDYTQPIRAWRIWLSGNRYDQFASFTADILWIVNVPIQAKCLNPLPRYYPNVRILPCRAPNMACQCGIYAFKRLDSLIYELNQHMTEGAVRIDEFPWFIGPLLLWGRIIEHEYGYRAEWAKIVEQPKPIKEVWKNEYWKTSEENLRGAVRNARLVANFFTRWGGCSQ